LATPTLISLFPKRQDLLALAPEDLGGVIIEIVPPLLQNGSFTIHALIGQCYPQFGPAYQGTDREVALALAEALSWLLSQGLLVLDPGQVGPFYVPTRRTKNLRTRTDVEAYRKGRILPDELLPPLFAEKVVPLFRRGDHDVAVFQAFKEVEVAVRNAANAKGAGYPDDLVGVKLMRRAFHPEDGPLSDTSLVEGEQEAEMHLFSGAIGHAKNPPGHRDVSITAQEAACLIVFASHLLSIVERRST
jgi:Protein of unknown function (Hypoth_ymh)